jgi:hypothetical protein
MRMNRTLWIYTALVIGACSAVSAQDPVDQQVSPEVKALQQQGAKEEEASRSGAPTMDQKVSPEVKSLEAAGASEDASSWHNLQSFIRQKVKDGLRGKALADAVRQERERLGLTGLDKDKVKLMQEYEQTQERIEKVDNKITELKGRLGSGDPYAANTAANNSATRTDVERRIKKREEEKKTLEKRSEEILAGLDSNAKF